MKKLVLLCFSALLLLSVCASPGALAAPSMTPIPGLPKPQTYQPITEQLGAQLQSLVTPIPANPDDADENNQEPPPTFGTRALNVVINIAEILRGESQRVVSDFSALPQMSDWMAQQRTDPRLYARWQQVGDDVVATTGIAFAAALALEFLLYPARRHLRRRTPHSLSGRMAVVLSLFLLRAIPILVFVAAAVLLLNQYDTQKLSRFLIMNLVYALALARTGVSFLRGVLSPKVDALRFVPATKAQAIYGFRWLCAFGILIVFGYFFIEVARAVHVPEAAIVAFLNLLGLILVVMGIVVIMQKRAFVAQLLRGNLSAAQHDLTWFESLRLWFARHWQNLAIAYLVIGYIVAAMGVQNGLVLMLRGTLLTLLVLVAGRLAFLKIMHWELRAKNNPTALYTLIKGVILRCAVVVAAFFGCLAAWGADMTALAASPLGHRLMGSAFSIGVTFLILGLLYESFSGAVERHLTPKKREDRVVEVNARARTLLPMMRNMVFVVFLAIIAVVVLSEAGINIGPLIAGAGVLGVAVGFGSQTLVKDFLTGLFIVLENTIAIGDDIKIGDYFGTVEAMSMRTLRLRDVDGALHIIPFSDVSKISNLSRSFAHAVIKVNVAVDTDLDKAMASMRSVGEALRADPQWQHLILEPLEVQGVDSINDTSVTLIARLRTAPSKQWRVRRMFLLRLKQQFDKDGIKLPSSTTIQILKDDVASPLDGEKTKV